MLLYYRSIKDDELSQFLKTCKIEDFETLGANANHHGFPSAVVCHKVNNQLFIQSVDCFAESIPAFLIHVTMKFECYQVGVQTFISTLAKNQITVFHHWSQFEEVVRYLDSLPIDQKKAVLKQHMEVMAPQIVGKKVYESEILIRAFDYFVRSRSLYNRLRDDYKLPSVSTLTLLTPQVTKLDDSSFLRDVFLNININQKKCNILVEVFVKATLQYHAELLAKTILGIMIKCLYGGPKFLVKMIPVAKLDAQYLYDHVTTIINLIGNLNGELISVICDDNHLNQAFPKKFETVSNKPWLI